MQRSRFPASSPVYAQKQEDGTYDDGRPHERDAYGYCKTCMAPPGCSHARCVKKEET